MAYCEHQSQVRTVTPSARGCEECLKIGSPWLHLRLCRKPKRRLLAIHISRSNGASPRLHTTAWRCGACWTIQYFTLPTRAPRRSSSRSGAIWQGLAANV